MLEWRRVRLHSQEQALIYKKKKCRYPQVSLLPSQLLTATETRHPSSSAALAPPIYEAALLIARTTCTPMELY